MSHLPPPHQHPVLLITGRRQSAQLTVISFLELYTHHIQSSLRHQTFTSFRVKLLQHHLLVSSSLALHSVHTSQAMKPLKHNTIELTTYGFG